MRVRRKLKKSSASIKMAQPKKLGDIKTNQTVFFLCDMQERFRPAIKYFDDIVEVAKRLVNVPGSGSVTLRKEGFGRMTRGVALSQTMAKSEL